MELELKKALEGLLICPLSHSKLSWVDESLLKAEGHEIYYPVVDGIVFLLPHHAIQPDKACEHPLEKTKEAVQSFYNNIGWKAQSGIYQDARDSEDLRAVCDDYIQHAHQRVKTHLPKSGRYLLDIASGPVQYPAYLSYSENFQYRVCADISLTALKEAQKKLNNKGLYLLCDITQLPIQDNVIDAIVSLHTLYHVPAEQQAKGFTELHRVLKPGGRSVIVYSWGTRSLLMNVLMFPLKIMSLIRRRLFLKQNNLYFHTHSYRWFCDEIQSKYQTQLLSWRSVNVPFLKIFIHPYLGGRSILKLMTYLEERCPWLMGRIGAYPLFVSVKK